MGKVEVFRTFADSFVLPDVRERFLHEAAQRPEKLYQRICHNIGDVFPPALATNKITFDHSAECFLLQGLRGFTVTTWGEASRHMGLGEGCLIIDATGKTFYAETEAVRGCPSITYAGAS